MKRLFVLLCALILVLGVAGVSGAVVLTFDDIATDMRNPIPDGYGGLNWGTSSWYTNGSLYDSTYGYSSGYSSGAVSGLYTAFNAFVNNFSASAITGTFDFNGAYLCAAWNNGLNVQVIGYNGATTLFDTTVTVNKGQPVWFQFDYTGVDLLVFSSFGGTDASADDGGSGAHFVMDNFTYGESQTVPLPPAILLFFSGLAGLSAIKRRFK